MALFIQRTQSHERMNAYNEEASTRHCPMNLRVRTPCRLKTPLRAQYLKLEGRNPVKSATSLIESHLLFNESFISQTPILSIVSGDFPRTVWIPLIVQNGETMSLFHAILLFQNAPHLHQLVVDEKTGSLVSHPRTICPKIVIVLCHPHRHFPVPWIRHYPSFPLFPNRISMFINSV
ncbi:MAG: hypothetical protein E6Z42_06130 [Bifidobacterium bifidum]|nr:hypothetical protein [Bifidobacterium bifidum]